MSLDLAELVSVTNKAVRSLEKSQSSSGSDIAKAYRFASPFESPRSILSSSDAKNTDNQVEDNGVEKSPISNSALQSKKGIERQVKETGPSYPLSSQKEETLVDLVQTDEFSDQLSRPEQVTSLEQDGSLLDKSKDLSIGNRQETTNSDNNLGSSQGSRVSEYRCKESSAHNAKQQEKVIRVNVSRNRQFRETGESSQEYSDDPEIIDIPEHILAVRSGMSLASEDSTLNEIDTVVEANLPPRKDAPFFGLKSFGKAVNAQGAALKQGALSKGILDPMETAVHGDVYISQFGLTERQRGLKEALAKRAENSYPKKKVVQPRIIPKQKQSDVDTDLDSARSRPGQSAGTDAAVTAAVAASAAVAATQPFLKAQQELESRMQSFLNQLAEIQAKDTGQSAAARPPESSRLGDLERQVSELNERRMEHLESLQQQQMQMQAQLLFLSRSRNHQSKSLGGGTTQEASNNFLVSRGGGGGSTYLPPEQFQPAPSKVMRTNTSTLHSSPTRGDTFFSTGGATKRSAVNKQPLFNPATLSSHVNYLNEVRELQGSHLDTPASREKVPEPTPYSLPQPHVQKNLGFLEELLAHKDGSERDTTFSVKGNYSPPTKLQQDSNNSAGGRRSDKSPVDTARHLVTSLSQLEKETADSLWGSKGADSKFKMDDRDLSPSPLERYLKHYESDTIATYEPPAPTSAAKRRARKHQAHLDQLLEARKVLRTLQATRETLEGNMEAVVRAGRDGHVFSAMLGAQPEGTKEQLRIQKMVNKKISALEADVQREVLRGLAQEQAQQMAAKRDQERQKLAATKRVGGASTVDSAFPTGQHLAKSNKPSISARQSEQSARLAYGKQNVNVNASSGRNLAAGTKGKENRTTSKVKLPPKPTVIRDEKTMVRTYGKPEYQRGRTTIRDPYMHFQNTKKGVASKTSLMNESAVSAGGRSRSGSPPKSRQAMQQAGGETARQFYFSPTRGYIPLHAGDSAPIQGQLISMAVPLGQPRMERGVRSAAVPVAMTPTTMTPNPVTSTPVPVTAARNVAMVSFPVDEEEETRKRGQEPTRQAREPELSTQVLPPIDIDSISPSSSRRSDIQIRSPQHGNANLTFLQDTRDESQREGDQDESDLDVTPTEGDPDLEQSGQGLTFPGYEPRPRADYSGPSFPPARGTDRGAGDSGMAGGTQAPHVQTQISDVMAEDLRRRDALESNAVFWLEQELMAQVLSKVMPVEVAQRPTEPRPDTSIPDDDRSEVSERSDSLLVADMIGQGGLQLFIDAGQPVDNALIQALVKEVLQEKVATMLAQGSTEGQGQGRGQEVKDDVELTLAKDATSRGPPRVLTPEPTPKHSPVASPRRQQSAPSAKQPITPPLSPPIDGFRFKPHVEQPGEALTEPPPLPPPRDNQLPGLEMNQQQQPQQYPQQQQQQQQQLPPQQQFVDTTDLESEPSVSIDISEELRRVAGQGKPTEPEEPVVSRHSVATPPLSPPPIADKMAAHSVEAKRQVTPPPSPSLVAEESAPARPRTPSPKRKSRNVVQEDTQEEEEEEEEEEEQPQPIMISVAVGEDHALSSGVQTTPRRTPSPKRPRTPVSVATEPSPPPSSESSVSETINENISEGQWLISRSEGQVVPGLRLHNAVRQMILKQGGANRRVDLSTASTLRDTDDLDLNDADADYRSEGEFFLSDLPAPDQDPMLQLLAEMTRNPALMVPQRDIAGPQVRQILSGPAPREVMSSTGRSEGELSVGQVPPSWLVQVRARDDNAGDQRRTKGESGQRRSPKRSPTQSLDRSLQGDLDNSYSDRKRRDRKGRGSRTPSPLERQQQREEEVRGGRGSPQSNGARSRTPPQQQRREEEMRGGRGSPQNSGARSRTPPQQQQLLSSGSSRGRSARGQMQYQPVLSDGAPLATRGRLSGGYRGGARRSNDSRLSRSSDRAPQPSGSSYLSDSVSRSADSVSLRRSGENGTGIMTSSFRSRQSSTGAKKSVDFDLSGTKEHRAGRSSRERFSPSRLSASSDPGRSQSLGLTYSFDESLDDSELKRIVGSTGGSGTGPYKMSVTIPSTAGDDDSELSEIDISDRHYR